MPARASSTSNQIFSYTNHRSPHELTSHIDKLISLYEKEHLSNLSLRETVRRLRQE